MPKRDLPLQRKLSIIPVAVVLSFLVLFAGCGGGSSGDPADDDGNDPPTGSLTVETAEKALAASAEADNLFLEIFATQGRAAATAAALAVLAAADEVAATGVSPDSTIWARFENGLLLAIYEPDPGLRGGAAAPDLAGSAQGAEKGGGEAIADMVVLAPFGHEFGIAAETDAAAAVDTCFGNLDDGATMYVDAQATVERFSEVLSYGPGVLVISTHGCWVPATATSNWVALMTGENYSTQQMAQRAVADYADMATAIGDLRQLAIVAHNGRHWPAITPAFVLVRGNFDTLEGLTNGCKSLVYLDACSSAHEKARMPDVFRLRGADKVIGWSEPVGTGLASSTLREFFRAATDTCTIREAWEKMSVKTAGKALEYVFVEVADSGPMMLRAQMPFKKDGAAMHGYSVGVAVDDGVTAVSCVGGEQMDLPVCNMIVHVPGTSAGSWDCVGDDDALISVFDFSTARYYLVQKDYVGVSGEIEVTRYDDDLISGTFHGTLGWWSGSSPTEDPPDATIEITDGVIKHVGTRY